MIKFLTTMAINMGDAMTTPDMVFFYKVWFGGIAVATILITATEKIVSMRREKKQRITSKFKMDGIRELHREQRAIANH